MDEVDTEVGHTGSQRIARYTYETLIIRLCLLYYCYAGCSLHSVEKVMDVTAEVLFPKLANPAPEHVKPFFTTISTWIQKCGLSRLNGGGAKIPLDRCCFIIDESISTNREKLGLILQAPAESQGRPLNFSDVRIVGMTAKTSRDADEISDELKAAVEKTGQTPDYIMGDGGKNLVSGAETAGYPYHVDCSHSFANILKSVYSKDKTFDEFCKELGDTRRYALTRYAYLMPPAMRTTSRFMNVGIGVYWAKRMIDNDFKMDEGEKHKYMFLREKASLVDELYEVINCIHKILKLIKRNGLSKKTVDECMVYVYQIMSYGARQRKVGIGIAKYFKRELDKMPDTSMSINVSSDIIESLFGYDKNKMSKNKRFGFTSGVLLLPLRLICCEANSLPGGDIKQMLERTTVNDVAKWSKDCLVSNQMAKRKEVLSA